MGTGASDMAIAGPDTAPLGSARYLALGGLLIAAGALVLCPAAIAVISMADPGALDSVPQWLARAAGLLSYLDYVRVPLLVFCAIKVLKSPQDQ
jgi:hypothetical protein